MRRLSGRFGIRKLIAVAGAGALLAAGLGVAGASAAARAAVAADGTPATSIAIGPCAIKYVSGRLYIGAGVAVYKVSERTGDATSIAPGFTWGQAFARPCGVAVDGAGNVLVADGDEVVAVAAKTGTFYGRKMVTGRVYPLAAGFSGNGAQDVQLDPSGNVVIAVSGLAADHTDNEQDSQVFVLAERAGTFYGKKMVKGRLYVIAGVRNGGGSSSPCDAPKAAAAVGATKAVQANLGINVGTLRFDAAGNILLADMGGDYGAPCGANSYDVPPRLALIPARTGSYYGQKMTVGYIYAITGLGTKDGDGVPAADSDIAVSGLAIDHAGNVLVAGLSGAYPDDGVWVIAARTGTFYGQRMRRDDVYVLPGLTYANLLAVDNAGNVLVVEASTFRVKMLAEKTGDYYGVKARAGRVYTIAGDGKLPL